MTLEDVKTQCERAIANQRKADPTIILAMPPGARRPKGFPRGCLLCQNHEGERVFQFDAHKMLKWIEKVKKLQEAGK